MLPRDDHRSEGERQRDPRGQWVDALEGTPSRHDPVRALRDRQHVERVRDEHHASVVLQCAAARDPDEARDHVAVDDERQRSVRDRQHLGETGRPERDQRGEREDAKHHEPAATHRLEAEHQVNHVDQRRVVREGDQVRHVQPVVAEHRRVRTEEYQRDVRHGDAVDQHRAVDAAAPIDEVECPGRHTDDQAEEDRDHGRVEVEAGDLARPRIAGRTVDEARWNAEPDARQRIAVRGEGEAEVWLRGSARRDHEAPRAHARVAGSLDRGPIDAQRERPVEAIDDERERAALLLRA